MYKKANLKKMLHGKDDIGRVWIKGKSINAKEKFLTNEGFNKKELGKTLTAALGEYTPLEESLKEIDEIKRKEEERRKKEEEERRKKRRRKRKKKNLIKLLKN